MVAKLNASTRWKPILHFIYKINYQTAVNFSSKAWSYIAAYKDISKTKLLIEFCTALRILRTEKVMKPFSVNSRKRRYFTAAQVDLENQDQLPWSPKSCNSKKTKPFCNTDVPEFLVVNNMCRDSELLVIASLGRSERPLWLYY